MSNLLMLFISLSFSVIVITLLLFAFKWLNRYRHSNPWMYYMCLIVGCGVLFAGAFMALGDVVTKSPEHSVLKKPDMIHASSASPDGKYLLEAFGVNGGIAAGGQEPAEGIRLLDRANKQELWSMTPGYFSQSFHWSPDSRYAAISYSARNWGGALILDAVNQSEIALPVLQTVLQEWDGVAPIDQHRPDPYMRVTEWLDRNQVTVAIQWNGPEETSYSGSYVFGVAAHKVLELKVSTSSAATEEKAALAHSDTAPLKPLGAAGELASYYDRHLAIKDGTVYGWTGGNEPQAMMEGVVQVGVGDTTSYALMKDGRLAAWTDDYKAAVTFADDVVSFSAGRTGIFVIRQDGSLWRYDSPDKNGVLVAHEVSYASIGDGTDYYVTKQGDLFAKGLAHRGQYGNGSLESTSDYVRVAGDVTQVRGHTGHAILLTKSGEVRGTGGNIYGPLSTHGLGDKATEWGTIFKDAILIATGSSHSVAVKHDHTLWIWGGKAGTSPKQVLEDVAAAAAGTNMTLAKKKDGSIWRWITGEEPEQILK